MKKFALIFISILVGITFIFSAYVKLYPIELFEYTIVDTGMVPWSVIPYFSRALIGMEFILGALLVLNIYFEKKQTLLFLIAILIFFTIYLVVVIYKDGNEGNCGCFGDTLKLTPLESIYKNIILLVLSYVLYRYHAGFKIKFQKVIFVSLLVIAFAIPYFLNPINALAREQTKEETLNYNLNLSSLYLPSKKDKPQEDLMKGKRIIAFMSLTCPHCKLAAFKLHLMHANNPSLPIYFILNGDEENLKTFYEESKSQDMPFTFMTADEGFVACAGVKLPALLWVNHGKVEKKTKYKFLNQTDIEAWLKKE